MNPQVYITSEDTKLRYFAGSKHPSLSTVRRWLATQVMPGRKIGKFWFLDVAAFEANGNTVLEKALRDVSRSS